MLVYKIWIQYTNLFKSYRTETIFQSRKRAITPKKIDGFYSKSDLTYILCIYLCTKFKSNTPTLSKDIAQKPFFKVEKGHNSQNNWRTLNRTWPTLYDYIPVFKISIQYTNPFKRYRMETKSVTYGTDRRTYRQRRYYMYMPPPPPIENGGGIIKTFYAKYEYLMTLLVFHTDNCTHRSSNDFHRFCQKRCFIFSWKTFNKSYK